MNNKKLNEKGVEHNRIRQNDMMKNKLKEMENHEILNTIEVVCDESV